MTLSDPVLLIRPSKLYRPEMSAEELYEATRGVWRINPRRAKYARYAFAVVGGQVVEVFEIERWQPAGTARYRFRERHEVERPGRYEFVGRRAKDGGSRYVGMTVDDYLRKGNQNPIKYVNC